MKFQPTSSLLFTVLAGALLAATSAQATPSLIGVGSINGTTDLSGLSGTLENGADAANVLGGIGSALAWAGGNTFLALPDRGPKRHGLEQRGGRHHLLHHAFSDGHSRRHAHGFRFPALHSDAHADRTTLFSSPTALNYGAATPSINTPTILFLRPLG